MKNKNIIIVGVTLTLLIILYFALNSFKNSSIENAKVKELNDYNTYLAMQEVINSENSTELSNTSYVIEEAYYVNKGLTYVYFLNGYNITTPFMGEPEYTDNIKYIFKIDGITYQYENLNANNIYDYAKEYNEEDIKIEEANTLPSSNYTEKGKLEFQIARFLNLITANKDEAYQMLTDKQKQTYTSSQSLYDQNDNILRTISPVVKEFTSETKKKQTTYNITDTNNNHITIIEKNIMEYKIEFN